MKSKFLSKLLFLLLGTVPWVHSGEYLWMGDPPEVPLSQRSSPVIVEEKPGSREVKSMSFGGGDGDEKPRTTEIVQLGSLPLQNGGNELTVACFIRPERKNLNEDLLSCKSDSRSDGNGFRLFKNWNNWGLDVGDGSTSKRCYAASKVSMNSWQHLAAVVRDGKVRFYHDGLPAGEVELESAILEIPDKVSIGSGPTGLLPYKGLITGIYISDVAVDAEKIGELMTRVTE